MEPLKVRRDCDQRITRRERNGDVDRGFDLDEHVPCDKWIIASDDEASSSGWTERGLNDYCPGHSRSA